MHDFLVSSYGGLSTEAKNINIIKDYINDLPEYAATFRLGHIDELTCSPNAISDETVEMAGAWSIENTLHSVNEDQYINPNHIHIKQYTDSVVNCRCGAPYVKAYDLEDDIDIQREHTEDCLPYYRLEARAKIQERRHKLLERCSWLGWKTDTIAPRLGMSKNNVSSFARQVGTSMTELRDLYRQHASETYVKLVREDGVTASKVADVYGHTRTTLTRWAKKNTDYESTRGKNQYSD